MENWGSSIQGSLSEEVEVGWGSLVGVPEGLFAEYAPFQQ